MEDFALFLDFVDLKSKHRDGGVAGVGVGMGMGAEQIQ